MQQLSVMGFEEGLARRALAATGGDVQASIAAILNNSVPEVGAVAPLGGAGSGNGGGGGGGGGGGSGGSSGVSSREDRLRSAAGSLLSLARVPGVGGASTSSEEALATVRLVVQNVMQNPDEQKFRRLKRSNKRFARSIGRTPPALEILEAVGFKSSQSIDELRLDSVDVGLFWLARELLSAGANTM